MCAADYGRSAAVAPCLVRAGRRPSAGARPVIRPRHRRHAVARVLLALNRTPGHEYQEQGFRPGAGEEEIAFDYFGCIWRAGGFLR